MLLEIGNIKMIMKGIVYEQCKVVSRCTSLCGISDLLTEYAGGEGDEMTTNEAGNQLKNFTSTYQNPHV